jgi:hypothetical protein
MFRRDEVTSRVKVTEIFIGEPAYVMLTQRAVRPDGKERTITQKVPVRDTLLLSRLSVEVHKGDEIEATIVTEWSKKGYITYLADFRPVFESAITPALIVQNS